MIDLVEMYVHWDAGRSQVQISGSPDTFVGVAGV